MKKFVPSSGETTIFVYDASGKMVAEYSTIFEPPSTAKVSYLTTDHLGSPRILTDANGNVISRRDFHPFGEEIITAQRTQGLSYAADSVRQKFTGYERDTETDLDYVKARYYNKNLGRFTTTDLVLMTPYRLLNPQAINLYVYVANTPLKFTDPNGKDIRFKSQADAEKGLAYYQNGLTKDEQKYLSVTKNKDGTFSLKVDEKAGKGAEPDSLLGRLYKAANGTDKIAIVSFVTRDTKFSITEVSADGKTKKVTETTLNQEVKKAQKAGSDVKELAGLTLLPFESRANAKPPAWAPNAYSTEANTTQIFVATDSTFATPTQAIYAETLAHFGEFVRTGNPVAATHLSSTVTTIEDSVVEEAGENEQANKPVKKPK